MESLDAIIPLSADSYVEGSRVKVPARLHATLFSVFPSIYFGWALHGIVSGPSAP